MDVTQMFLARHGLMHTRVDGLTEGLTDEQVRGHVHPAANPLAWLLWHIARSEDASVNLLVAAGPQVLDDAWARRLKVARRDIGEGMTMAEVEKEAIVAALTQNRGNRRKAAEMLGIGERTLYRKIKAFKLD
jgi:DNA-binding NtrC family response regulator